MVYFSGELSSLVSGFIGVKGKANLQLPIMALVILFCRVGVMGKENEGRVSISLSPSGFS